MERDTHAKTAMPVNIVPRNKNTDPNLDILPSEAELLNFEFFGTNA